MCVCIWLLIKKLRADSKRIEYYQKCISQWLSMYVGIFMYVGIYIQCPGVCMNM